MTSRFTTAQQQVASTSRLINEMAKWVLTNKKAGPAQRRVLTYASLKNHRNPHRAMINYIKACIEAGCGQTPVQGFVPQNTVLCELIDEYIASEF